jgi:hypothetical protein
MMNKSLRACGRESSGSPQQRLNMVSSRVTESQTPDKKAAVAGGLTGDGMTDAQKKSRRFRRL